MSPKETMKLTALAVAMSLLSGFAVAQERGIGLPPASPPASATRTVGTCKITVEYASPAARGRAIFGGLVPFDQVWRTGANAATTIEISGAAKIGGKEVPAGKYGLFTIPGKDQWTIILNNKPKQWGSYEYKESQDLARVEVKPTANEHVECLDIRLSPKSRTTVHLEILWEKTKVAVPIEVDVDGAAEKTIAAALEKSPEDPDVLFQAADYMLSTGKNLEKALTMIQKANTAKPDALKQWRMASIEMKLGKYEAALANAETAIKSAKATPGWDVVVPEIETTIAEIKKAMTPKRP